MMFSFVVGLSVVSSAWGEMAMEYCLSVGDILPKDSVNQAIQDGLNGHVVEFRSRVYNGGKAAYRYQFKYHNITADGDIPADAIGLVRDCARTHIDDKGDLETYYGKAFNKSGIFYVTGQIPLDLMAGYGRGTIVLRGSNNNKKGVYWVVGLK